MDNVFSTLCTASEVWKKLNEERGRYTSRDDAHLIDVSHIKPEKSYKDIFPDPSFVKWETKKGCRRGTRVFASNLFIGFDIETTSFKYHGAKVATMYCWQICVNFKVYIGRTREEFLDMLEYMASLYGLDEHRYVIWGIHNLGYEFEWFMKWLPFDDVFAREAHKPMKAFCSMYGMEWRCTYVLSSQSLSSVANNLTKYRVRKTKEKFDYSLLRGVETELTEDEIRYCVNDVVIVCAYLMEQVAMYDLGWNELPMTNTGRVRNYCKEHISNKTKRQIQSKMRCTGVTELKLWNQAFAGGFTHGNYYYAGQTLKSTPDCIIHCYDFTSSYPAVCIYEDKYPMSSGRRITLTEDMILDETVKKVYIFKVRFTNIRQREDANWASPLSKSKCRNFKYTGKRIVKNGRELRDDEYVKENNGKVLKFEGTLETSITCADYRNFRKFYKWDDVEFGTAYEYDADYLPLELRKCILHFFIGKTYWKNEVKRLKKSGASVADITNATIQMMVNKGMLNSTYGMMVLKITEAFVEAEYMGDWNKGAESIIKIIDDYNEDKSRFLFFSWGIFVTAYARRNLLNLIHEVGTDFIYGDTDSVTYFDYAKHEPSFAKYNRWVWKKLELAAANMGLDKEELEYLLPGDKDNIKAGETFGMVDSDKFVYKFKHLGAKRYIYQDFGGNIHATIAGVSKRGMENMLNHLRHNYEDPFDAFEDDLHVEMDYTCKQASYYFSDEIEGDFVDYQGNINHFKEHGYIYMEPTDYTLGLSGAYEALIGELSHDDTI